MKRRAKSSSTSLEHRLSGYALAASAAGVSVLALIPPAEAKIVYTPTHVYLGPNGDHYNLKFYPEGSNGFKFLNTGYSNSVGSIFIDSLTITPEGRNGVAGHARVLRSGTVIGPEMQFKTSRQKMLYRRRTCTHTDTSFCHTQTLGSWDNVRRGYLGLKFHIHGKVHYGWARLNVKLWINWLAAELLGYAYETIPGKSIITGKTKGPDVITLEPATLGALAAGANGLHTWRQK